MRVIVRYQDGSERAFPASLGWNYHAGSLGSFLWDNHDGTMTWKISNGAVGREVPGGVFYGRIMLELPQGSLIDAALRIGQYVEQGSGPTRIGFGTGQSYLLPGAVKVLRFTTDGSTWARCYNRRPLVRHHPLLGLSNALGTQGATYDAKAQRMFNALKAGTALPSEGLAKLCGEWMPYGDTQAGAAGGEGIDPYPGWQGSSAWALLVHDLTLERHAVEYRDANTGAPRMVAAQQTYRATRGWGSWTTHQEFVKPVAGDAREPFDVNTGLCPYRSTLLSYLPIDDQHLVRATAAAKIAAILYGDECAKDTLRMTAADAWMGLDKTPVKEAAKGSGYGRGYAWTLAAMNAANLFDPIFEGPIGTMVRAANRVQMPNGSWFRAESKDENAWAFAPSPWRDLGLPRTNGAVQTMEMCYLACALADAGETRGAVAAYMRLLEANAQRPLLKWTSVSYNDVPTAVLGLGAGVTESYWLWPLAGKLGTPYDMEKMVPPGASTLAGSNVKAALMAAGNFGASAKALERLEQ